MILNIQREIDDYTESKLRAYKLPIIKSVNHLFLILKISEEQEKLFFYHQNREYLYHKYQIPKAKNGVRIIESPIPKLKDIQSAINKEILSRFRMCFSSNAYVKRKSIVTNALPHVGAKILLKFDIKDFFDNINFKMVYYQFRYFGYGKNVSKILAYICTDMELKLPQGAPTSPSLSNLVCLRLDSRIQKYCLKHSLAYTRYADDITISIASSNTMQNISIRSIQNMIYNIIEDTGFTPNKEKCKIYKNGQKLAVTGVVINNKINANKTQIREVENAIRYISKYGLDDHLAHINYKNNKNSYINHIYGLCYYIKMINPLLGNTLLYELNKLNLEGENYD